jgi:hypothetical protein
MVMPAWTNGNWNAIIDQINALIASCGGSVAPLTEVAPKHIWTVDDVTLIRNTLTQLCSSSNPTFSASTRLWSQAIIDEINNAIANCNCGPLVFNVPTQFSDTTTNLGSIYQSINRIYYVDPATVQLTPALQRGESASVVDTPTTRHGTYISVPWNIPIDCNGEMNYGGAQLLSSSGASVISLAPAGTIPVAYDSQWSLINGQAQNVQFPQVGAKITVSSNPRTTRTVASCTAADYCIDSTLPGASPITLGQPRQWFQTLAALESAIAAYNAAHPTSQVRLSSLQPWATIWPNTAYYQVLLGSLNYVVLAYV